jgi:PKD repeat protein
LPLFFVFLSAPNIYINSRDNNRYLFLTGEEYKMRDGLWTKGLVLGIIGLFFVTSFTPAITTQLQNKSDLSKIFQFLNRTNKNTISLNKIQNGNTEPLDITTGLIANWKFDESSGSTAYDSVGSYDGTLNGNPQWVTGKIGGALQFDGDGDFVTTPLNQLGAQTISLWFKVDTVAESKGTVISTHEKDDNTGNLAIAVSTYTCGVGVVCIDPGSNTSWWNPPRLCSGPMYEYNDNNWHHLAFTHDGLGNYELFIDRVLKDTYSGSALTDIRPYVMGEHQSVPSYYWLKGALDEVRIYNRTLNQNEIDELYAQGNPLVAEAGGPYYGIMGTSVHLYGNASGGCLPLSWHWDFGDGNTSTQQNPSHIYNQIGVYSATLTVNDSCKQTDFNITNVNVAQVLETNAHGPYYGTICTPVQFQGTVSGGYPPYTYNWVFGDGNISMQQNPSHRYTIPGNYTVKLSIVDSHAFQSNETTSVMIIHSDLIARAHGPYTGIPQSLISFRGSVTGGCPPYSWHWNFGDGNTSIQQNPSHAYRTVGNYTVTLTVIDNLSHFNSDYTSVEVTFELRANAHGPYNGTMRIPVQFFGNATGGFPPYTWLWDFGDGSKSTQQNQSHAYKNPGNYTIVLSVSDSSHHVDNASTYAEISYESEGLLVIERIYGGFGVNAIIKNTGTDAAMNVPWWINVTGGIILTRSHFSGTIPELAVNDSTTIKSTNLWGIGSIIITVQVGDEHKQAKAFLLGPLVLGVK